MIKCGREKFLIGLIIDPIDCFNFLLSVAKVFTSLTVYDAYVLKTDVWI